MTDIRERLEHLERELGDLQGSCGERQASNLELARWQVMSVLASLGDAALGVGVVGRERLDEPSGRNVESVGQRS